MNPVLQTIIHGTSAVCIAVPQKLVCACDCLETRGALDEVSTTVSCKFTRLADDLYALFVGQFSVPDFNAREFVKSVYSPTMSGRDLADHYQEHAGELWLKGIERTAKALGDVPNRQLELFLFERSAANVSVYHSRFEAVRSNQGWTVQREASEWSESDPAVWLAGISLPSAEAKKILMEKGGDLEGGALSLVARECDAANEHCGWPIDLLTMSTSGCKIERYTRGAAGKPEPE